MEYSYTLRYKFIITACLVLMQFMLNAQTYPVRFLISVLPPYERNIADYQNHPERIILKMINTSQEELNVQLGGSFSGDNMVSVSIRDGYSNNQPIRIAPGATLDVNTSFLSTFFDLNAIEFSGITREEFLRTGILPEGNYKLCLRAYDYRTRTILSDENSNCSNLFPVQSIEPPLILNPLNESVMQVNTDFSSFVISWTIPPGKTGLQYTVRMVEVFDNRNSYDAMMSSAVTPIFEQTVQENILYYGPSYPPLIKGRKYALMVTARDPTGSSIFRNNGSSSITSFVYGQAGNTIPPVTPPVIPPPVANPLPVPVTANGNCQQSCLSQSPATTVANTLIAVRDEVSIGNFTMTILEITPAANGKFNGTGTIPVPFLNISAARLKVTFTDAIFNNQKQMVSGSARGIQKSGAPSLVPNTAQAQQEFKSAISKVSLERVMDFAKEPGQRVTNTLSSIANELPLGISISPFTLAVYDVVFTPNQAYFSAATQLDISDAPGEKIILATNQVCMSNASTICGNIELYLAEDLVFPLGTSTITLLGMKKENNISRGTFVRLNKSASEFTVEQFNVAASYTFPPQSLIDVSTQQPLKAILNMDVKKGWDKFMATLNVPEFYIPGLNSFKFNVGSTNLYWDHSTEANPPGLPQLFSEPAGTDVIETGSPTWQGFYFPSVSVTMPQIITNVNVNAPQPTLVARNLIFDGNGFTGNVSMNNLISIGDGALKSWYASVDLVSIDFWKNSISRGTMNGKLVLPPCGRDVNQGINQLDYTCTLSNPSNAPLDYEFMVEPKNGLSFSAFFMKVDLLNTSRISISSRTIPGTTNTEVVATATLNGFFGIDDTESSIKGVTKMVVPHVEFNNLTFTTKDPYIDTNMRVALKYGSPDKTVAGFSMSLDEVPRFFIKPGSETRIGFNISGSFSLLGKDNPLSFKGKSSFSIYAKVASGSGGRVQFDGIEIQIEDITLGANAKVGGIGIAGAFKYYNIESPAKKDHGFIAALQVTLPAAISLTMRAQVGTTNDALGDFNYFAFDGLADFGNAPIPAFGPISIFGFGGGVAYNQEIKSIPAAVTSAQAPNQNMTADALLNISQSCAYVPKRGNLTVNAKVLFGLAQRNTFDADAKLTMSFTASGGISQIMFEGNARFITDIETPLSLRDAKSLGVAHISVLYDNEEEIFELRASANMGFPIPDKTLISVRGQLTLHIQQSQWYLHIGRPEGIADGPAQINVLGIFNGTTYFEAGNSNIDDMPDIPKTIIEMAGKENRHLFIRNQAPERANMGNKEGFIHGAAVYFDVSGQFLIFTGSLKAGVGYDIAFLKRTDGKTPCKNGAGANGWYATGQAYIGAQLTLGIKIDLFFVTADYTIFDAGAVAVIRAGLPNPSWCEGLLMGYYTILEGMITGNFNYKFQVGDKCISPDGDALKIPMIADVTPQPKTNGVEIMETPQVLFNMEIGKVFPVKYIDENGQNQIRRFVLNQRDVVISLKNTKTGQVYTNMDFSLSSSKKAMYFNPRNGNALLDPNITYEFKIRSTLYEVFVENGVEKFRIARGSDNRDAIEDSTVVFVTDSGLKKLEISTMVYSVPLHSHKSYPTGMEENAFFLKFTGNMPLSKFKYNNVGAKIEAHVFAGNSTDPVHKFDVSIINDKWMFPKFDLLPGTSYKIAFIFKRGQMLNASVLSKNTIIKLKGASIVSDGKNVKITNEVNIATERLGSNQSELIFELGFISFSTSRFNTYLGKLAGMELATAKHHETINNVKRTYLVNRQKMDSSYLAYLQYAKVENGRTNFSWATYELEYTGELFSDADVHRFSSDDIFPSDRINSSPRGSFPALMTIDVNTENWGVADEPNRFFNKVFGPQPNPFNVSFKADDCSQCNIHDNKIISMNRMLNGPTTSLGRKVYEQPQSEGDKKSNYVPTIPGISTPPVTIATEQVNSLCICLARQEIAQASNQVGNTSNPATYIPQTGSVITVEIISQAISVTPWRGTGVNPAQFSSIIRNQIDPRTGRRVERGY